jgi:hypothetical protein
MGSLVDLFNPEAVSLVMAHEAVRIRHKRKNIAPLCLLEGKLFFRLYISMGGRLGVRHRHLTI